VFTERAAELGYPREPGETVEEYRVRLGAAMHEVDEQLAPLSDLTTRAAYAPTDPDASSAADAGRLASTTLRLIRERVSLPRRIAGHYRRSR